MSAVSPEHQLVLSEEVAAEYRDVLSRPKFDRFVGRERLQRIIGLVLVAADWVVPTEIVQACADPKDDKYLALAAAGCADVIVSGDERHLLLMSPWRRIMILRIAAFLDMQVR